jgi:hypothetical protein
MAVMKEEEWEDKGEDWVLSQVAWRRMNQDTIGMMFDSCSNNEEEWEQDSVGMDITAILAHHHHVLVVVDMALERGGVAVVLVLVHSRQICDDNNSNNNQE